MLLDSIRDRMNAWFSKQAATERISSSEKLSGFSRVCILVQRSFPVVKVPVLSKATILTLESASKVTPPFSIIPCLAEDEIALK